MTQGVFCCSGMCGICGNFNGIDEDDLVDAKGNKITTDEFYKLGNSWEVFDDSGDDK